MPPRLPASAGAPKGEGLDDSALIDRPAQLAGRGISLPDPDGQLGAQVRLGLDRAEAPDDVDRRTRAGRIEKMLPEPPPQGTVPGDVDP